MSKGMSLYRMDDSFRELLVRRRHEHVGIIAGIQSPRLIHNQIFSQASEVICFRLHDGRDHRKLKDIGFSEEEVRQIAALPNYQFISKKF